MKYGYFFYVIMGFLSGSILFGRLIPMIFRGVDVQTESEDGNPGMHLLVEALFVGYWFFWQIWERGRFRLPCAPGIWEWIPGCLRW